MKVKIGIILFLLVSGFIGYFLYISIESYEETVAQGWSKKAKRNPYLALQQYLERHGSSVESSSRLKQLDSLPQNGIVFIADTRQLKKQSRIDALINWMEDGGTLVVGAQINNKGDKNVLLDYFGVTKEAVDCDCEENSTDLEDSIQKKLSDLLRETNEELKKKKSKKEGMDANEEIPEAELTKLNFNNIEQPVRAHFGRSSALVHPALSAEQSANYEGPIPFYWEGNQAGSQIIQFTVGRGLLTVISDSSIWDSESIDTVDHAYLSTILLGKKENVVLLYGMQLPSIWGLLARFSPELLIACLVWLLAWMLYKVKRFGPVRELDNTSRRSLDEHISAMNGFLWRSNKSQKIIENMHKIIIQQINSANPGFASLDDKEQARWIGEHCTLSQQEVEMALFSKDVTSEEHFYQITRLIQKIGNRL